MDKQWSLVVHQCRRRARERERRSRERERRSRERRSRRRERDLLERERDADLERDRRPEAVCWEVLGAEPAFPNNFMAAAAAAFLSNASSADPERLIVKDGNERLS